MGDDPDGSDTNARGASAPPAEFRFSVRRLLLLVVLVSATLTGFRVLGESWSVWLATAAFYLAVVLMFTPPLRR